VQAKLKLGTPGSQLQGIWPAFWSVGAGIRNGTGWPACGEIGTFENINGGALGYGTVLYGANCGDPTGISQGITFDYGSFHTWSHIADLTNTLNWRQQSISFLLDNVVYKTVLGSDIGDLPTWQALVGPIIITVNVAVGGQWPGAVGSGKATGAAAGMEVQYVAVYESI
jgi:beta-glucanase (GH16 family)